MIIRKEEMRVRVKWEEVIIVEHELETEETDENTAKKIANNELSWTEDELSTHKRKIIFAENFKMEVI